MIFQNKIWIKESAEQNFMYGNHVYKSGLSRISENTPKYAGVVVLSSKDIPLVRCSFMQSSWGWEMTTLQCVSHAHSLLGEQGVIAFKKITHILSTHRRFELGPFCFEPSMVTITPPDHLALDLPSWYQISYCKMQQWIPISNWKTLDIWDIDITARIGRFLTARKWSLWRLLCWNYIIKYGHLGDASLYNHGMSVVYGGKSIWVEI